MTTNAQAALMAAATFLSTTREASADDLIRGAETYKAWLDEQDAADRQIKGRVVPKRDLDAVSTAFGKTPKPDNVVVMEPGQLAPNALQLVDSNHTTQWVTYEHALAQGWVAERG